MDKPEQTTEGLVCHDSVLISCVSFILFPFNFIPCSIIMIICVHVILCLIITLHHLSVFCLAYPPHPFPTDLIIYVLSLDNHSNSIDTANTVIVYLHSVYILIYLVME